MIVGIVGAGTMGSGIAQLAASSGAKVKLYDTQLSALENSKAKLEKLLTRLIAKGRIKEAEITNIQANISYVDKLDALIDSDLIIEAIIENLSIKKQLFSDLENHVSNQTIIATNTSSLSVTSIAAALKNPARCIGLHFFNPAPLMQLVEVIPAIQSSKETLDKSVRVMESWGKTIAIAKDTPGFIVNRVARPFYGESLRIYEEGIADVAFIDWSLKTFGGFRMGAFELMDFIGNDVNYIVTETVFTAFYFDPRYKPAFTQKRLSEAGYFGRKSAKGYYDYDKNGKAIEPQTTEIFDETLGKKIFHRVLVMLINEAADALLYNIASAKDIDNAMTKGVNYPKGLLAWADEKGIDWCVEMMDSLYEEYHEDRYRCSALLRKMQKKGSRFFE